MPKYMLTVSWRVVGVEVEASSIDEALETIIDQLDEGEIQLDSLKCKYKQFQAQEGMEEPAQEGPTTLSIYPKPA